MPGIPATAPRNCWITWSTLSLRSARGLSRMKTTPEFPLPTPPRPPAVDMNPSTFGFFATISATARWCCTSDSNEIPSAASVKAKICPVSVLGMNPLGIATNIQIVASWTAKMRPTTASR